MECPGVGDSEGAGGGPAWSAQGVGEAVREQGVLG